MSKTIITTIGINTKPLTFEHYLYKKLGCTYTRLQKRQIFHQWLKEYNIQKLEISY